MNQILNPERLNSIFNYCLFRNTDAADKNIPVKDGIVQTPGFHVDRIAEHKAEIEAMLAELPGDFQMSKGGGMSFLNACIDKNGEQWTDFQMRMEQLFQLGMAIDKVKSLLKREFWPSLPGSVPYYVVIDQPVAEKVGII